MHAKNKLNKHFLIYKKHINEIKNNVFFMIIFVNYENNKQIKTIFKHILIMFSAIKTNYDIVDMMSTLVQMSGLRCVLINQSAKANNNLH